MLKTLTEWWAVDTVMVSYKIIVILNKWCLCLLLRTLNIEFLNWALGLNSWENRTSFTSLKHTTCQDVLYSTLLPAHHLECFFFSFSLKMIYLSTVPHSLLFLARSLLDRANLQTWLRIPNGTVMQIMQISKMLLLFKTETLRSNANIDKYQI